MNIGEQAKDFLGEKRIAIIGVSRNQRDFSRVLFREFLKRGYDVIPVNPAMSQVEDQPCFANIGLISPPPAAALVMTKAEVAEDLLGECARCGIRKVWLYRATGKRGLSRKASELCARDGIKVIAGYCPFLFLPQAGLIHRFHRALLSITTPGM
ncbi:MAG: CoA-binding protein [Bryobacterales bacterium]|nr:CoA-binding protein [Bryobacterales bacterium]